MEWLWVNSNNGNELVIVQSRIIVCLLFPLFAPFSFFFVVFLLIILFARIQHRHRCGSCHYCFFLSLSSSSSLWFLLFGHLCEPIRFCAAHFSRIGCDKNNRKMKHNIPKLYQFHRLYLVAMCVFYLLIACNTICCGYH